MRKLSTIEAIESSIDTDTHVYRWFLFFILQPAVQSFLSKTKETSKSHTILKGAIRNQRIVGALFLLSLWLILLVKSPLAWVGIILVYPLYRLHAQKKKCVVSISRHLIESDFKRDDRVKQTLYQISEQYSRKYHIPSIVDYICVVNRVLRWTILCGLVLVILLSSFKGIQGALVFLAIYSSVYFLVNSIGIYKYIK